MYCDRPWKRVKASHLLVEPFEDVLLCDNLKPVAVHLLSQVSVLAFLQLDKSCHLRPEGVLAQCRQTRPEADQELLNLGLHQLCAAWEKKEGFKEKKKINSGVKHTDWSTNLNFEACVSTVTENPSIPEVFLQVGYTWYLEGNEIRKGF